MSIIKGGTRAGIYNWKILAGYPLKYSENLKRVSKFPGAVSNNMTKVYTKWLTEVYS